MGIVKLIQQEQGYENVCDLRRDADGQLNITGPNFHVYVYTMDDELRVT
jgi:hypothetical protein